MSEPARSDESKIYLATVAYQWDSLKGRSGETPKIDGTRAPGYCLWFSSYADFKAEYPDKEPMVLHITGPHRKEIV